MRGIDTTSLASLTAGCIAATGGLAKIVGEEEFPIHFHQGQRDNLHITLVAKADHPGSDIRRAQLTRTWFDLRVKKAGVLNSQRCSNRIQKRTEQAEAQGGCDAPFAEITDEDIDNLFSNLGARTAAMSFINYSSREINCKIVYYGPGLCGKTTNLAVHLQQDQSRFEGKDDLARDRDRENPFLRFPAARARKDPRFPDALPSLYTVPGQVFYDASRKLILKGVDGVVFVADSQIERMEANLESLDNLKLNLAEQGYELDNTPYVVQYNKRDLPNSAPLDEIRRASEPDRRSGF